MLCADVKKRGLKISNEALRRIGMSDSEQRWLGIPISTAETTWCPESSGRFETGDERSRRMEKQARTMKTINLDDDSDEPLPSVPILSTRGGR